MWDSAKNLFYSSRWSTALLKRELHLQLVSGKKINSADTQSHSRSDQIEFYNNAAKIIIYSIYSQQTKLIGKGIQKKDFERSCRWWEKTLWVCRGLRSLGLRAPVNDQLRHADGQQEEQWCRYIIHCLEYVQVHGSSFHFPFHESNHGLVYGASSSSTVLLFLPYTEQACYHHNIEDTLLILLMTLFLVTHW